MKEDHTSEVVLEFDVPTQRMDKSVVAQKESNQASQPVRDLIDFLVSLILRVQTAPIDSTDKHIFHIQSRLLSHGDWQQCRTCELLFQSVSDQLQKDSCRKIYLRALDRPERSADGSKRQYALELFHEAGPVHTFTHKELSEAFLQVIADFGQGWTTLPQSPAYKQGWLMLHWQKPIQDWVVFFKHRQFSQQDTLLRFLISALSLSETVHCYDTWVPPDAHGCEDSSQLYLWVHQSEMFHVCQRLGWTLPSHPIEVHQRKAMVQDINLATHPSIFSHTMGFLRPFYAGIVQIMSTFCEVTEQFKGKPNGALKAPPCPNTRSWRTCQHMLLRTHLVRDSFSPKGNREYLDCLCTPLGEIKFLWENRLMEVFHISEMFMETMNWQLLKLESSVVSCYDFSQKLQKVEGPYFTPPDADAGSTTQYYLIVRIGDVFWMKDAALMTNDVLMTNEAMERLMSACCLCPRPFLSEEHYAKDKQIISALSQERQLEPLL